ncbi:MAG TPA: NADH-quinone oxidoreductase subunit L [Prolixibacteraceae bacterium]
MLRFTWLVPFFPLIGFLLISLNFRRLKGITAGVLASGLVLIPFLISLVALGCFLTGAPAQTYNLFSWISIDRLSVPFSFLLDRLSVLMLLIITGVGFLIHVYSIGYMKEDAGYNRFFSYMNLFVFFMLVLVLGSNYLIMFIGWEGVGLCSYLLIGFWFKNQEYNNAAKKAFIMNRIGDLGFLLALFMIIQQFGSLNFVEIFSQCSTVPMKTATITAITMLLFAGAVGKSAQIPLFTWLPDAMAGPTPVSALIHAATMVTAGVYMVARSNILFVLSPITMLTIAIIGVATALMAGSIAMFQNDIKKILAYSTISQLGLMFVALGTGAFTGAMFHLTTHAFFKALLFLAAGSVIHALSGEQDIRKMGGLKEKLPYTFWLFLIGSLAIAGIPPFAGFFSKDMILIGAFHSGYLLWTLSVLAALMTSFYIFRLLFIVFWGPLATSRHSEHSSNSANHFHESPKIMLIPMSFLAVLAVFGGLLGVPHLLGGSYRIKEYLAPLFASSEAVIKQGAEEVSGQTELWLMVIPLLVILAVIYFAWMVFVKNRHVCMDEPERSFFSNLIFRKFYIDELYETMVQKPVAALSIFFHEVIELKVIDRFVNQTGNLVVWIGKNIRYVQTGNVGAYLFYMVISIILILVLNLFK